MTRVAIVADSHFAEDKRFEECVRIHRWIADDMRERNVDVVLHAGDVYERASTPVEREAVADWVMSVTQNAPMMVVRGNHDRIVDLRLLERLRTRFGVKVEEAAGFHVVADRLGRSLGVACVAWPHAAELARSGMTAGAALEVVMRELGERAMRYRTLFRRPVVLLAHAMVTGSVTSTGQPLVGAPMEVGLEQLGLVGADFYALGHVHKGQSWAWNGAPVWYPGSPRRTNFGETEPKGYLVVDFAEDGEVTCERIETPCTPMLLVEDEWNDAAFHSTDAVEPAGAEIRFRYRVADDQRETAAAAAAAVRYAWMGRGAAFVQVEPVVIARRRARAPEVARATTLGDKIVAMWEHAGTVPEPERRARLLAKLGEVDK